MDSWNVGEGVGWREESLGAWLNLNADHIHGDCTKFMSQNTIDHFTLVCKVTWPMNGSEAEGDLFVLLNTSLFLLCKSSSYAN